jgi:hypothetical protein
VNPTIDLNDTQSFFSFIGSLFGERSAGKDVAYTVQLARVFETELSRFRSELEALKQSGYDVSLSGLRHDIHCLKYEMRKLKQQAMAQSTDGPIVPGRDLEDDLRTDTNAPWQLADALKVSVANANS